MTKKSNKSKTKKAAKSEPVIKPPISESEPAETGFPAYCSIPMVSAPQFAAGLNPGRLDLIIINGKKWVNGTTLHYYFFNEEGDGRHVTMATGKKEWRAWKTTKREMDVVRQAFDAWKAAGIGLNFKEVSSRDEAEIRIGFERKDGAWSFVGRDIIDLGLGRSERTMNFGWDLTSHPGEIDTAIHEIGHTLGFPHEHQNPIAGIAWDEEAVYAALAKPPNRWSRETTFHNIIRKISPDTVQGSEWDPNSIMHYPFEPGLIKEPAHFHANGIRPAGGLSVRDKSWVKSFYPPLKAGGFPKLKPAESVRLSIAPGEQKNFEIEPQATRNYEIRTFGASDTVMVLFERDGEKLRYLAGDDDGGEDRNAYLKVKLFSGKKYVLRIRLYYAEREEETAVMMW